MKIGDRVRIARTIDLYPLNVYPVGLTGTVCGTADHMQVRLDQHFGELEEWGNCLLLHPSLEEGPVADDFGPIQDRPFEPTDA